MTSYLQPGSRRNRLILTLTLMLVVFGLLWIARGAMLPYILASVLIYLLLPAVNWLDKRLQRWLRNLALSRGLSILIVYLAALALVALFISMIVPVLLRQFAALWNMRETMALRVQDLTTRGLSWYRDNVPADIQTQVDDNLRRAGTTVGTALQVGVMRTLSFVTGTVSFILGFAVIPFWMFYVLFDQPRLGAALHGLVPARLQADVSDLWRLIDTVLGAYIRGQLLLSLTIGLMATLGLTLLGVPFPAVLGLFAALFEFLPFIGPILGAIPAVLVALLQSPVLAFWTIILCLGIQQIENLVLAPRITGNAVELHPAVIMVVLVIGNEVAGLWGMLVAVPVTAILRDVFRYLYLRVQDEPCGPTEALRRMGRAVPAKA